MNCLFLVTHYALESSHSWLSDILAEEMALSGKVVVVYLDWSGKYEKDFTVFKKGVEVHVISTKRPIFKGSVGKLVKWLAGSRLLGSVIMKKLSGANFDVVINYSPAMIMHPVVRHIKRCGAKAYLILWDFFPIYHSQLGLVPLGLFSYLKRLENNSYNDYDAIGLMSPANLSFLKNNYSVSSSLKKEVFNLWGPNDVVDRTSEKYEISRSLLGVDGQTLVSVFGGQLIPGRGINKLIELACFARNQGIKAKFFILGDGPERDKVLREIDESGVSDSVIYRGFVPRDEYVQLLCGADIGLVFNSGTVPVPTFPSKVVDYFRVGLPVLSYVEDATDFGLILETVACAGWAASPANENKLFDDFFRLSKMSRDEMFSVGARGQAWYLENMAVNKLARKLVDNFK